VACRSIKAAISLKRVKIEEKLLWRAYRKSPTLFLDFLGRSHTSTSGDGRFCLIFARTAQQSVLSLDGTNGLSSSKPCAYCRIVQSGASRGNLCNSTDFLFGLLPSLSN